MIGAGSYIPHSSLRLLGVMFNYAHATHFVEVPRTLTHAGKLNYRYTE
jgi:hypothetical protein